MTQVTYLNGNGGGFAETMEVEDNTTAQEFLSDQMDDPSAYKIRINNEVVTGEYELQDGDMIIANPVSKNIDSGVLA